MLEERVLYEVDQLPVFQNRMYDTEAEAKTCTRGDVCLVENLKTGLIYNATFQPELMDYDEHYQNEQAVSPSFKEHLNSVEKIVERNMGRSGLVEVGCGKGAFLETLLYDGFDIIGFDPTYEGSNPRIARHYFEPGLGIKASGLILRHVLEHIQDPYSFLKHLQEANGGRGLIYIEVPCLDWICEHRAWFDVFYEHVNYFRLSDFHGMFGRVIESGRIFGEQYLYVVADLASLKQPRYDASRSVNFPVDFLKNLQAKNIRKQNTTAVWGGASKGVIFAVLKSRLGQLIDIVIDINPAKQGKYLPGCGIVVQDPESALKNLPHNSTIFVMNSNYLNEIKKMSSNVYNYVSVDHE
ncbi:class I SAM-dependent methyltransferase [Pseudomonadales bacterium]|nr:class I SAM-dependent methyltransferase [Pseudomonadales bacterium]